MWGVVGTNIHHWHVPTFNIYTAWLWLCGVGVYKVPVRSRNLPIAQHSLAYLNLSGIYHRVEAESTAWCSTRPPHTIPPAPMAQGDT